MTAPENGRPSTPVSFEELADLRTGLLSTAGRQRLWAWIAADPAAVGKLASLDAVDELFAASEEPASAEGSTDMPADVAARLAERLALEARRRAQDEARDATPHGAPCRDEADPASDR